MAKCLFFVRIQTDLYNFLCTGAVNDGRDRKPGVLYAVLSGQTDGDRINVVFVEQDGLADSSCGSSNTVAGVPLAVEDVPAGLDGLLLQVFAGDVLRAVRIVFHDVFDRFAADDSRMPGDNLAVPMLAADIGGDTL